MLIYILLLCLIWRIEGRDRAAESSAIRPLSGEEDITEFVKGFRFSMLIWEKPKCAECEKFKDDLEDVAKMMVDARVPFARINAADKANVNMTKIFNISETPTYVIMQEFGKNQKRYVGEKSKEKLSDWVNKHSRPAVLWCDSDLLCRASIASKYDAGFVGSFQSKESPGLKIYKSVSENFPKSDVMMMAFINVNETDEYGTVSITHPNEMKLITNIVSEEQLEEWLLIESFPLFGPLHPGNYPDYKSRSDNWVIFAADHDDYKHYGKYFRNAAIEKRDFYNFVWLDSTAYPGFIDRILGVDEYPRVGVVVEGEKRYLMSEKTKITAESIVDFVLSVESGKAVRYVRSEDIPSEKEGPGELRTVVARTFKTEIMDTKIPQVMLVHSSTCAHCIAFMPKLAALAKRLGSLDSELRFARFDGIRNDIPSKHYERGYLPALFLTLPGEEVPKYFNLKNRTDEAILKFLYKYLPKDLNTKIQQTLHKGQTSTDKASKDEL